MVKKLENRLKRFTFEKSFVPTESLEEAGGNFKDLANLGALMLNVAAEANLRQVSLGDAKKAMTLSHMASARALEIMPSNVICRDNMVHAQKSLEEMGVKI